MSHSLGEKDTLAPFAGCCVTEGFIAMTDCCRLFDGRMDVAGGGLTDGRQLEARISSDESPGLVGAAECSTFQKVPLDLLYSGKCPFWTSGASGTKQQNCLAFEISIQVLL